MRTRVVTRAAKQHGLLAVPGLLHATEAFAMLAAGADALKLFPAEAAQPGVLRSLRAVLPRGDARCCRSAASMRRTCAGWRAAGAAGFGIGSAIYKPGDSADTVAAKARALLAAI